MRIGASLLDHDRIEPLDRVAGARDAPAGHGRVNQSAKATADHGDAERRRDAEMLDIGFVDGLRMIDEQVFEHRDALSQIGSPPR